MKVTMHADGSFVEVEAFEFRRVLDDLVFTTEDGRVCARLKLSQVRSVDLEPATQSPANTASEGTP